jgi:nucleoid-associated protein YgaU
MKLMKLNARFLAAIFVLVPCVFAVGQNLQDNPDYRESLRFKQLAEEAVEEGDYDKATEYAELSREYADKSAAYVDFMLAKYRANQSLNRAKRRSAELDAAIERGGQSGELSDPPAFEEANTLITQAETAYREESFEESKGMSDRALDLMGPLTFVRAETADSTAMEPVSADLPAFYIVRRLPGAEDCYWRIAQYEFVYDDAAGWWPLYMKNKHKMPEPENPDLIHPGMVMEIPPREGEVREGYWVDGVIRASPPKP